MNRLASISVVAIRALAALMLVALLAGGSNAGSGAAAHTAGHVHLHLESGEAGLHAQDANCCQPAASNAACVGGCAFACGAYATPSPSLILDGTAEIDPRFPSLRHPSGAMPDLATPPPKVLG
jgi:hypothetical protein